MRIGSSNATFGAGPLKADLTLALSRIDLDSHTETTVVDEWFGLTFNSPNDIVVKSDGTVWFTDPSYGYLQGVKDAPLVGDFVYRHDPERLATALATLLGVTGTAPNSG